MTGTLPRAASPTAGAGHGKPTLPGLGLELVAYFGHQKGTEVAAHRRQAQAARRPRAPATSIAEPPGGQGLPTTLLDSSTSPPPPQTTQEDRAA